MQTKTITVPNPKNLFYKAGRSIGLARRGLVDAFSTSGSRPQLTDDSAWVNPYAWGDALLQTQKVKTKEDFVNAFQTWVYICSKRNANGVASVPLKLYAAKQTKGKKLLCPTKALTLHQRKWLHSRADLEPYLTKSEEIEEITEHPFIDTMRDVNPYHNARDLKELTTIYCDLTGEAYWFILPDKLGIPEQIWPIPSQHINPKFGKSLDKVIEYFVYERGNVKVNIPTEFIVHFKYANPHNPFVGFSTVKGVADAVYIQSQMSETEIALFENRARPGGIFTSDENVGRAERQRFEEQMKLKFTGSKKAGKYLFLPRGIKYDRDTMTPTELNFIEGRKMVIKEICASFDIPEAIYISESSNRSVSDSAKRDHAEFGILPRCERYSEKINEVLMPRYGNEKTKIFCAFDNPVPADRALLMKERSEGIKSGYILINEVRSEMGDEPVEGGDDPLVSNQLVTLDSVINPPEPPPMTAPPINNEVIEEGVRALRERLGNGLR